MYVICLERRKNALRPVGYIYIFLTISHNKRVIWFYLVVQVLLNTAIPQNHWKSSEITKHSLIYFLIIKSISELSFGFSNIWSFTRHLTLQQVQYFFQVTIKRTPLNSESFPTGLCCKLYCYLKSYTLNRFSFSLLPVSLVLGTAALTK